MAGVKYDISNMKSKIDEVKKELNAIDSRLIQITLNMDNITSENQWDAIAKGKYILAMEKVKDCKDNIKIKNQNIKDYLDNVHELNTSLNSGTGQSSVFTVTSK